MGGRRCETALGADRLYEFGAGPSVLAGLGLVPGALLWIADRDELTVVHPSQPGLRRAIWVGAGEGDGSIEHMRSPPEIVSQVAHRCVAVAGVVRKLLLEQGFADRVVGLD